MDLDADNFTRLCGPLSDAMLLVTADGAVLAGNAAAAALWGCAAAELRERPLRELLAKPSESGDRAQAQPALTNSSNSSDSSVLAEAVQRYLRRCARSGDPQRIELPIRAAGDRSLRCQFEGTKVRPQVGSDATAVILVCRAVRDRSPVSGPAASSDGSATGPVETTVSPPPGANLCTHGDTMHVIMSSIADAVITTDGQGCITFMNPIAEALTGWPHDQSRGKPLHQVFQVIHQSSRHTVEDPVSQLLRINKAGAPAEGQSGPDSKPPVAQTLLISRQGFERPLEDLAVPIRGEHGEIVGAVLVFRDATGRREQDRQAEALLAREKAVREQAQLANRIKDEFLATLSHELRTPLSAITGWVELLQHANLPPEQAARGLEVIKRNVRAQTQLINDLLDVSRILSGKLSIESKPVNLIAVVAAALDSVQLAASAKGISLRTHLDADASLVQGDPTRLQQVLWNVLQNAIKFTPNGGWVDIRLQLDGKSVQLSVSDNGVGIAPEFLPHLFERFRQADSTTTRRHGGLGLGLALVRELTELHGGLVVADSPGVGKGTTITLWLPQRTAPLASRSAQGPSTSRISDPTLTRQNRLTGLRMLLVEDDDDSREIVSMLLHNYGATVVEARSAVEAMEQLHQNLPDIVVSDIGLPDEDGFSLIRKIRHLPPEQGGLVPALALTAFARNVDSERALQEGFQMHLAKPATPQELIDTIARLVGRA